MQHLSSSDSKESTVISFSTAFLASGLILILASFKYKVASYNNNELKNISIVLYKKPDLVIGSKITSRYEITSNNYGIRFWVTEGAYRQISENVGKKELLNSLHPGDTLNAKIESKDIDLLADSHSTIRIIGLSKDGIELIDPTVTSKNESNTFYWFFWIGTGLLLTGLLTKFFKR